MSAPDAASPDAASPDAASADAASPDAGAPVVDEGRRRLADALAAAVGVPAEAVTFEDADGELCLDVPPGAWTASLRHARDAWDCRFFDWLSAVDQTDAGTDPGFDVVAHLVHVPSAEQARLRRVLLRTRVPSSAPALESATSVYAGAAWAERETHEMFGIDFHGFDDGSGEGLRPLLLPDGFVGTPWRKEFPLASRAAKAWPGAKDPGESDTTAAAPSRRKLLPPGVPDPATWGPRPPAAAPAPVPPGEQGGEPGA